MSFIDGVIEATRSSQKNRAEYDRITEVLTSVIKRKIKKNIMDRATCGFTDVEINMNDLLRVDNLSRWSVDELVFTSVFQDSPRVFDRLFSVEPSHFTGFDISLSGDVLSFDWTVAMLGGAHMTTPTVKVKTNECPPKPVKVKTEPDSPVACDPPFPLKPVEVKTEPKSELPVTCESLKPSKLEFPECDLSAHPPFAPNPPLTEKELVSYLVSLMPSISYLK